MRLFVVCTALVFSMGANGAIYKCNIDGQAVFSQIPCAADAEEVVIKVQPKMGSNASKAASEKLQQLDENEKRRELDRAKYDLRKTKRKITKYEKNMKKKLATLRGKKKLAANNLAGAQWESSISEEMSAVTSQYSLLIENARKDRKDLESRIVELR
jgi:hypothetical protein